MKLLVHCSFLNCFLNCFLEQLGSKTGGLETAALGTARVFFAAALAFAMGVLRDWGSFLRDFGLGKTRGGTLHRVVF